jgi:hypothetical protein
VRLTCTDEGTKPVTPSQALRRRKNPCSPGFRLHWQASPANTGGLHLNRYILAVDLGKYKSVFCKLHTLRRGTIAQRRQIGRTAGANANRQCEQANRLCSPARVFECRGVPEPRVKAYKYNINTSHRLTPGTRRLVPGYKTEQNLHGSVGQISNLPPRGAGVGLRGEEAGAGGRIVVGITMKPAGRISRRGYYDH